LFDIGIEFGDDDEPIGNMVGLLIDEGLEVLNSVDEVLAGVEACARRDLLA